MVNYSYLLKTINCSKIKIDWSKFTSHYLHYHYIYNKKEYLNCKTLLDFALFLNGKKLYGYFEYYYSKIFDNLIECLIWPENENINKCQIFFDYNHLGKIWCLNIHKDHWYITLLEFEYNLTEINDVNYIKHMFELIKNDCDFERIEFNKAIDVSKIFL